MVTRDCRFWCPVPLQVAHPSGLASAACAQPPRLGCAECGSDASAQSAGVLPSRLDHERHDAPTATPRPAAAVLQDASFTSGIFQLPSMIDGGFSFGQYSRIISTNSSFGAGSQFDSLSLPGDSAWM